ncbi:MAG: hypothetical protein Q8Q12_02920 [bacterium]|nr:hypothetical protein [bacterium]
MEPADSKTSVNFVREHVRILSRHKFLVIIPVIVAFFGATIVASSLPKTYKAVGVFRDMGPSANVTSTRRTSGEDGRLAVMKAIIFSRSNLVEVLRNVGLDASFKELPEPQREAYEESIVTGLRKNLRIELSANDVYQVSYKSEDPDLVHRVVNEVIQNYIDRVVQEETTSLNSRVTLLETQVKDYDGKVAAASEAVKRFNVEHILQLPGTVLSAAEELRKIIDDLRAAEQSLADAETTKKEIERQVAELDPEVVGETLVKDNPEVARYKAQINELELKLAEMLSTLKEAHPAVVDLRNQIETRKLLMQKAAQQTTTEQKRQANPRYLTLLEKLDQANIQIVTSAKTRDRLLSKRAECEERVKQYPVLQTELGKLMKEEEELRSMRERYTTERENAWIIQANERNRNRFVIQDLARKPTSPEGSNKRKLALLGLIVGTGLGIGLAVLRDVMDSSFKNVQDVASFLDIPVVGTIPAITTAAEKARDKKREKLSWMVVAALVILFGAALVVVTFTSL